MKALKIVVVAGFAAAVTMGALAVGCGPQKTYCPQTMSGQCNTQDTGVMPPAPDAGAGESIILNDDAN